jgi:hypothetical protein
MKLPQKRLIEYIKKIFSDLHSAIVGAIVTAIILSIGSIYLFAKNLWNAIINTIRLPTPLWATIALVFVVMAYIYLKQQKKIQSSKLHDYKTCYFTIGNYKWETKIYEGGYFEVEKYPFCIKHDLRFIFGRNEKYCPGTEKERCNNRLSEYDEFAIYESAKSIIENKIRNKKC